MKTYNPKISHENVLDCPCWNKFEFYCNHTGQSCPDAENGCIPESCRARGEGILIQVEE